MSIRKPVGANYISGKCVFSLWAPRAREAWLEIPGPENSRFKLQKEAFGYWELALENVEPGTNYFFNIDQSGPRPDPASRYQPEGVHGPSEVIDQGSFNWTDDHWNNHPLQDYIIYELHTGTFTSEGDFGGIASKLDYLARLGVTSIELMPVAAFPGTRNWGYDGVYPFAVQNSYGGPFELMKLVDLCHRKGLAVILDVVYNHLGPEGNYLGHFGPYFTSKYHTPWGEAVNFDDRYSDGFRNYVVQNALMWFRDYHIDALRLDAVHAIYDFSARHIMQELAEETEVLCSITGKQHYLIAESDLNDVRYISPVKNGGYGLDAQWSDDFHHAVHALVTGERDGYYMAFGDAAHLAKAFSNAFVYDGIYSEYRKRTYGSKTTDNEAFRFVVCSQNHDQTGNRKKGDRLTTLVGFETLKLVAGTVLTSPFLPLLFMGEEYGEKNPFLYFVSHNDPELNRLVKEGRQKEFSGFYGSDASEVPDPSDEETYHHSTLSWNIETGSRSGILLEYYRELIRLRKENPVLSGPDKKKLKTSLSEDLLMVERWTDKDIIWCYYNFGNTAEQITVPSVMVKEGIKVLDSADEKWLGPGTSSPGHFHPESHLQVNAKSLLIYSTA